MSSFARAAAQKHAPPQMPLCDVHRFRGVPCSYALKCQAPTGETLVYVGSTSDIEGRMVAHGRGTGAVVTTANPPTGEILHIREHATAREALLCEVALWNLWAGKLGDPDKVRGARWNMEGPMPFHPRSWTQPSCPDFGPAEEEKQCGSSSSAAAAEP